MKKLIILLFVVLSNLGIHAQESTTDYIYSSEGFVIRTAVHTELWPSGNTYEFESQGLYSKDGKIFVKYIDGSKDAAFYILDGCETIASGAFSSITRRVLIPSSIKSIAPDAFGSNSYIIGIHDGVKEQRGSGYTYSPLEDPDATEVARYNLQGFKIPEPINGVNIVHKSDGTAEKILVTGVQ